MPLGKACVCFLLLCTVVAASYGPLGIDLLPGQGFSFVSAGCVGDESSLLQSTLRLSKTGDATIADNGKVQEKKGQDETNSKVKKLGLLQRKSSEELDEGDAPEWVRKLAHESSKELVGDMNRTVHDGSVAMTQQHASIDMHKDHEMQEDGDDDDGDAHHASHHVTQCTNDLPTDSVFTTLANNDRYQASTSCSSAVARGVPALCDHSMAKEHAKRHIHNAHIEEVQHALRDMSGHELAFVGGGGHVWLLEVDSQRHSSENARLFQAWVQFFSPGMWMGTDLAIPHWSSADKDDMDAMLEARAKFGCGQWFALDEFVYAVAMQKMPVKTEVPKSYTFPRMASFFKWEQTETKIGEEDSPFGRKLDDISSEIKWTVVIYDIEHHLD